MTATNPAIQEYDAMFPANNLLNLDFLDHKLEELALRGFFIDKDYEVIIYYPEILEKHIKKQFDQGISKRTIIQKCMDRKVSAFPDWMIRFQSIVEATLKPCKSLEVNCLIVVEKR